MRRFTFLALVTASVAFATSAAATSCPDFEHPLLSAGPAIDLGGGIVGQKQSRRGRIIEREASFAESIYLFHDCDAGPTLWMQTFQEEPEGSVVFDSRDVAAQLIGEIEEPSLQALIDVADPEIIRMQMIDAVGIETCLCAAVYPDLQGDKVAYENVQ